MFNYFTYLLYVTYRITDIFIYNYIKYIYIYKYIQYRPPLTAEVAVEE